MSNLPGLQGSFQVCLDKIGDSKEAQSFLAEGCRPLKTAFAFDSLLLRPAAAGVPLGGQTILWSVPAALPCLPTPYLPSVPGITTSAEMRDARSLKHRHCQPLCIKEASVTLLVKPIQTQLLSCTVKLLVDTHHVVFKVSFDTRCILADGMLP